MPSNTVTGRNNFRPGSATCRILPILAGAGLVVGCSSQPTRDARHTDEPVAAVGGGAPRFHGEYALAENGASSGTMLVSLYGETALGVAPATGSDGDVNLKQISFAAEGGDFTPDIDRSGRFLVYASKQHSLAFDLYRKAVDGRTVTQLTSDPADDMMPAIAPDGSKIAFVSNRNGNWDVFVMPIDGGPATQVTFEKDDEVQPTWSPDGKQIAFARKNGRTTRWELWTADADQPSGATYLCDGFLPKWCPDQSQDKLLFQRARQQGSRMYGVWTIDLVNGQAINPTEIVSAQNAAVIQPSWSPDGKRIVFTTVLEPWRGSVDLPEQSDLWVIAVDGTGRTALTNGRFRNMQPVWGPNDRIYFVSNRGGVENLWSVSPEPVGLPVLGGVGHGAVAGAMGADQEDESALSESSEQ